jgi:large subunit ribosomal protein L15
MQLNTLKRKTPNRTAKRVGRGGGRGKTAGRGTKGQNARAGHKKRPDVREKLKKLPKLRGYAFNSIENKPSVVNIAALEKAFAAGETVSPATLTERGLVRTRKGDTPKVKILGEGELTKKLTVTSCSVSSSAKEKIEKAGGSLA